MIDERNFDGLSELQAALRIGPSADFAARVRARVAGQPIRARWWLGDWKLMLAGATIAIGLIAGAAWLARSAPQPTTQSTSVTARSAEPQPAAIVAGPVVAPLGRRSPTRGSRRLTRTNASTEPEVLVPPDQAIALRQILAEMKIGTAEMPSPSPVLVDAEGRLPAPAGIQIQPIMIEPLGPPIVGGGSRERQ